MRGSRGFTIAEVLVAIMLLSVALSGLVTTAGVVTRMIGEGHGSTRRWMLAAERVETLRAGGCPAAGRGWEARGPYTVAWEVSDSPEPRSRALVVRVSGPAGPRASTDSLRALQLCP